MFSFIPISIKIRIVDSLITGILKLTPTKKDDEAYKKIKDKLVTTLKKVPDEILELGKTENK